MVCKVRLLSPWHQEMQVGKFHFSVSFSAEEADALLCEWAPYEELFSFPGPKAWYCCEATNSGLFRTRQWQAYLKPLKSSEFLYHAHPNIRYRVPHITHVTTLSMNCNKRRLNKAVAIVSNTGGAPWRRSKDMSLRVKFATHPDVDLYGRRQAWEGFRAGLLSRPGPPRNYRGEIEGDWHDAARFDHMSHYKAAVCLENTCEPFYFTEKFVCAVQAGCIPIYHAHETVREGVLKGAAWVDPAMFKYDVNATIEYALGEDIEEYWAINGEWLKSEALRATHVRAVFERIGQILYEESLK